MGAGTNGPEPSSITFLGHMQKAALEGEPLGNELDPIRDLAYACHATKLAP